LLLKLKHSQDNKQEAQWKYKKKGTSIIDKWNTANIMPIGYSSMQEGLSLHAMHTHHFCKSGATIPTYMQGHPPKNGDIPLDINKMSLLQSA